MELDDVVRALAVRTISIEEAVRFVDEHRVRPRDLHKAFECTGAEVSALMQRKGWQKGDVARYCQVSDRQVVRWLGATEDAPIPHKYGARILGVDREHERTLNQASQKWASTGKGGLAATGQVGFSNPSIGALPMSLKNIEPNHMRAYLTTAEADVCMGAMAGYSMFAYGQLHAASHDATLEDPRVLREGYAIVEAPAVRTVCDFLEPAGRILSRNTELFGDLKTLILGFANSVVTMTVPEPDVHLIALFHPKRLYHYGYAIKAQDRVQALVAKSVVPNVSHGEIARLRNRNPFAASAPEQVNDISLGNLLRGFPQDLSSLMSRAHPVGASPAYSEQTRNSVRGFVLLERGENGKPVIRSASSSVVEMNGGKLRYKEAFLLFAMEEFSEQILGALTEGQELLHAAPTVEQVTGRLRTFWLSFDNAVVGINPFDDRRNGVKGSQYYLLSVYSGTSSQHLNFNYGQARARIRALCQEAD